MSFDLINTTRFAHQGILERQYGCSIERTPATFQPTCHGTLVKDFHTGNTLGFRGPGFGCGGGSTLIK